MFTTDVFGHLDADHVLAPVGIRKQKIMTRSEFERKAKDICASKLTSSAGRTYRSTTRCRLRKQSASGRC